MTGSGAVLDANALHPKGTRAGPRDTLLRAAEAGLYRPYWSAEILAEVERTLTRLLARRGRADSAAFTQRLLAQLAAHFPDALVAGYEPLLPTLTNGPKDRHVLAAAIASGARAIVTESPRHFPGVALRPHGLAALMPDDFLTELYVFAQRRMAAILVAQGADLRRQRTLAQVLDALRAQAPRFVAAVEAARAEPGRG